MENPEWKKQGRKKETEGGSERKQSSGGQTGRNEVKLGKKAWERRKKEGKRRKSRIDVRLSE